MNKSYDKDQDPLDILVNTNPRTHTHTNKMGDQILDLQQQKKISMSHVTF